MRNALEKQQQNVKAPGLIKGVVDDELLKLKVSACNNYRRK